MGDCIPHAPCQIPMRTALSLPLDSAFCKGRILERNGPASVRCLLCFQDDLGDATGFLEGNRKGALTFQRADKGGEDIGLATQRNGLRSLLIDEGDFVLDQYGLDDALCSRDTDSLIA